MYKLFSVGRWRCSFQTTGQCEGLYIVERATSIGSTFEPVFNFADIDYQYVTSGNLMR